MRVARRALRQRRRLRPRKDESEIAGAFRQRQQLLIGLGRDLDFVDVRHAGAFLSKPFSRQELIARVREALDR